MTQERSFARGGGVSVLSPPPWTEVSQVFFAKCRRGESASFKHRDADRQGPWGWRRRDLAGGSLCIPQAGAPLAPQPPRGPCQPPAPGPGRPPTGRARGRQHAKLRASLRTTMNRDRASCDVSPTLTRGGAGHARRVRGWGRPRVPVPPTRGVRGLACPDPGPSGRTAADRGARPLQGPQGHVVRSGTVRTAWQQAHMSCTHLQMLKTGDHAETAPNLRETFRRVSRLVRERRGRPRVTFKLSRDAAVRTAEKLTRKTTPRV